MTKDWPISHFLSCKYKKKFFFSHCHLKTISCYKYIHITYALLIKELPMISSQVLFLILANQAMAKYYRYKVNKRLRQSIRLLNMFVPILTLKIGPKAHQLGMTSSHTITEVKRLLRLWDERPASRDLIRYGCQPPVLSKGACSGQL